MQCQLTAVAAPRRVIVHSCCTVNGESMGAPDRIDPCSNAIFKTNRSSDRRLISADIGAVIWSRVQYAWCMMMHLTLHRVTVEFFFEIALWDVRTAVGQYVRRRSGMNGTFFFFSIFDILTVMIIVIGFGQRFASGGVRVLQQSYNYANTKIMHPHRIAEFSPLFRSHFRNDCFIPLTGLTLRKFL